MSVVYSEQTFQVVHCPEEKESAQQLPGCSQKEQAAAQPSVARCVCAPTCFGSETSSSASRPHAATQHKEDSTLFVCLFDRFFLPSLHLSFSLLLSPSLSLSLTHNACQAQVHCGTRDPAHGAAVLFRPVVHAGTARHIVSSVSYRPLPSRTTARSLRVLLSLLVLPWTAAGLSPGGLGWPSTPLPIWVARGCYSGLTDRSRCAVNCRMRAIHRHTLDLKSQRFAYGEATEPVIIVIASACTRDGKFFGIGVSLCPRVMCLMGVIMRVW